MASSDSDLKTISRELKNLSLKRKQLLERKKILCIFQELRNRTEFGETEEAKNNQIEIIRIDEKLRELSKMISELQKTSDTLHGARGSTSDAKYVGVTSSFPAPATNIFYVEAPPTIPAPTVILDVENLPLHPCRTQCPQCRQFVMTETFSTVSSVTWLVCLMTAMIGCVAGCCLIPFCLEKFKSITHRCPKCQSSIVTIKKL